MKKPVSISYKEGMKRIGNKKYQYGITATDKQTGKRYWIESGLTKGEAEKILKWIKKYLLGNTKHHKLLREKHYDIDFKNPRIAKM